jgi:hypothetical protein
MHQLYPEHAKALQHAGLNGSHFPTLKQVLDSRSGALRQSRSRSGKKSRAVFFCLGYSRFWNTPIHVLLRRLCNKYNLLWLRVTMSCHRFKNNLCEMFQGHLNRVLMKSVELEDYCDRPCNCPGRGCRYGNVCRKALIVYKKVTIPRTGKYFTLLVQRRRR